jgi:hypothetical protein
MRELKADLWRISVGSYSTHGATVPRVLFTPRLWWLGLEGRRERRLQGFAPGRQEKRVFLLISYLI